MLPDEVPEVTAVPFTVTVAIVLVVVGFIVMELVLLVSDIV